MRAKQVGEIPQRPRTDTGALLSLPWTAVFLATLGTVHERGNKSLIYINEPDRFSCSADLVTDNRAFQADGCVIVSQHVV